MAIPQHAKITAIFIIAIIVFGYFFAIHTPLQQLLHVKKHTVKTTLLNMNIKDDKNFLTHLDVDMPMLLATLATNAQKNLLQLKNIAPTAITYQDKFKIEAVDIAAHGNYYHLIKFIKRITQLPYITRFFLLELTKSAQQLNLQMTIEVYHY